MESKSYKALLSARPIWREQDPTWVAVFVEKNRWGNSFWVLKGVKSCCWLRAGGMVILNHVRDQMVPFKKMQL